MSSAFEQSGGSLEPSMGEGGSSRATRLPRCSITTRHPLGQAVGRTRAPHKEEAGSVAVGDTRERDRGGVGSIWGPRVRNRAPRGPQITPI